MASSSNFGQLNYFFFRIAKFDEDLEVEKGFDQKDKLKYLPFARMLRGPKRRRPFAFASQRQVRISRKR